MKHILLIVFVFTIKTVPAQVGSGIPFISHLINKGYYKEAVFLIDRDRYKCKYGEQQQDSINYFYGWAHYSLKNLGQSTLALLKVGEDSPFYLKSRFFAGYNQIFIGDYQEARNIFERIGIEEGPGVPLLNFELGGIEMLQGNWTEAKRQLKMVCVDNATLGRHVTVLEGICKEQETHRSKSPVLAGIMSGVIPGTGKIYAGKTGAGIASMLGTFGIGLITWENYHKLGIANAKTIIFGSIFIVNYVSNIYGSVVSVKIIENGYKNAVHKQILFQLHIPLRNFFE